MSDDLLDELNRRIEGDKLDKLSRHVGADAATTKRAVEVALPELVRQLGKNARSRDGAESLARALDKDHDGSVLENMDSYMESPEAHNGQGILKHIFGDKRGKVESKLGKKSGLSKGAMGTILVALAPLLMGMLGKKKKSGGLDAGALGGLLKKAGGGLLKNAGCLMGLLPLLTKLIKR